MSLALRVFLLICAVLVLVFVIRKIKKSEFETMDAIFWLLFIAVIAILAIFPGIAYVLSGVLVSIPPQTSCSSASSQFCSFVCFLSTRKLLICAPRPIP